MGNWLACAPPLHRCCHAPASDIYRIKVSIYLWVEGLPHPDNMPFFACYYSLCSITIVVIILDRSFITWRDIKPPRERVWGSPLVTRLNGHR